MSTAKPIVIIECYDSGVRISDGESLLANSPSYALIETSNKITVGEAAEHQAHLRPREVSTLFWSDLSANSTTKHVVSNAELALHHLQHVWQLANCTDQDAIIITPTTFDKHHLGILLGICKKLSINVVGIVCNAALAMRKPVENCKAVYLDLLQQCLIVTELNQNTSGVEIKQPSRRYDYGLQNFTNNCAKTIANKFISETRFDPLHNAKDEQQFFDKLPFWLNTLKQSDTTECKLSIDDKHFSIEISQQQLQEANHQHFDEIAAYLNVLFHSHDAVAIYCSSSCLQVFGLAQFLSTLPGCALVQLDEITLAKHALHCKDEIISEEQVLYVNSLPWLNNSVNDALSFNPGKLSNLSSMPTHILIAGHAYCLQQDIYIATSTSAQPTISQEKTSESICKISTNSLHVKVDVFNSQEVQFNYAGGANVIGTKIGDIISIQGCDLDCQFIKVVQHET